MRKYILPVILYINLGIIVWFWVTVSGRQLLGGGGDTVIALGRLAGLVGMLLVLGQVLLMSGARWFEDKIGFDRVTRYHRINGITLALVLMMHPVLLVQGYALRSDRSPLEQYFTLIQQPYVILAMIALDVLLAVALISAWRPLRKKLSYEQWYGIHLLVYVVVLLAFGHQFANGAELLSNPIFRTYWIALYLTVFALFFYRRLWRPFMLFRRHRFAVERVERLTPNSVNIYIGGQKLDQFEYRPGQFNLWRFQTKELGLERHPFTISKEFDGTSLRISAKGVGDFSKALQTKLNKGTRIVVDGPYGVFTPDRSRKSKVLMVAGGSGITPMRAMLPELLGAGKEVRLLFGNKSESDTMLESELDQLAAKYPNFSWVNVISEEGGAVTSGASSHKVESGYIDADRIKRHVGDPKSHDIYLCGPPAMDGAVTEALKQLGVDPEDIIAERFSFAS